MSCPAAEILMEIRDRLRNLDTLEERREKNRLQMAAKRAAAKVVYTQESVYTQQETEKGKEKPSPHTPYKEKSEKREKAAATATTRGRAHARPVDNFTPPTREEVVRYAAKKNIPEQFVAYWFDCMENNYTPPWYDSVSQKFISHWRRSLLVYWSKSARDHLWREYAERHDKAEAAKPKTYPREDWILCEERCQYFDAHMCRCLCGFIEPPTKRAYPLAPEECVRFHTKTKTNAAHDERA